MYLDRWYLASFRSVEDIITFYFDGINTYQNRFIDTGDQNNYVIKVKVTMRRIGMARKMKRSTISISFIVSTCRNILFICPKGICI
jgi:hypothetical protein